MLMALKKKMVEHEQGPQVEIDINANPEDENDPHDQDEVAGPAPMLEHDIEPQMEPQNDPSQGAMNPGDAANNPDLMNGPPQGGQDSYEGSPLHMAILQGLGGHGTEGREPLSLREKASVGVRDKMAAMRKK